MNVPRCSACQRIAIVEIEDNVFLCKRCETIFKREFPNAARSLSDLSPAPALAVMPGSIDDAAKADLSELATGIATRPESPSGGCLSDARNETASIRESCGGVESRHAAELRQVAHQSDLILQVAAELKGPHRRLKFAQAGLAPGPQDQFPDIPEFLRRIA